MIDLKTEYPWLPLQEIARQSLRSQQNLLYEIFEAFLAGRQLLSTNDGSLNSTQLEELKLYRDHICENWEQAFLLGLSERVGLLQTSNMMTAADFYVQAEAWSVLKGLALSLSFSPHSRLSKSKQKELAQLIGQQPSELTAENLTLIEELLNSQLNP